MSYNLVNPTTGALTRVAGRGRAEYGASTIRKGTVSVLPSRLGENFNKTVNFDTPMPDSDYEVDLVTTGFPEYYTYSITSKTTSGFHIVGRLISDATAPVGITFNYTAFKLYSDVEYSNIVNSIPADASASNKLVTKSDLPKKYIDTGSGVSFDTCRIALGLSYPCRFKFEFWAIDNSCFIEGYAYRGSASAAPITRYVGTDGYVINSNAGGTMACYTGNDNVPGSFICTELKE